MRPYLITAKLMRPSNMKRFPTPGLDKSKCSYVEDYKNMNYFVAWQLSSHKGGCYSCAGYEKLVCHTTHDMSYGRAAGSWESNSPAKVNSCTACCFTHNTLVAFVVYPGSSFHMLYGQ
jgi:hypothetical protein